MHNFIIESIKVDESPSYLLKMYEPSGIWHTWSVNVEIKYEPRYKVLEPQYKFVSLSTYNPVDTNIVEVYIKSKCENCIFQRKVIVEKIKLQKNEDDPLKRWIVSSSTGMMNNYYMPNIFTRDLILTKIDKHGNIIKNWFLTDCSIISVDFDDLERCYSSKNNELINLSIRMKPKTILEHR